jgi:hypothetical protein
MSGSCRRRNVARAERLDKSVYAHPVHAGVGCALRSSTPQGLRTAHFQLIDST